MFFVLTYYVIYTNYFRVACWFHPVEARMPKKITWTDAQDSQIKRMRALGKTWDTIAATLAVTRWTVIDRGRRIGARPPPPGFTPEPEDPERPPMRPGDPCSWGAITHGTALQGMPYPPRLPIR